ncbi:MAG TPA: hypothetical protein VLK29_10280 [Luteimonas sp.]|nr:hypothetical protein [Luteimonas sp.]
MNRLLPFTLALAVTALAAPAIVAAGTAESGVTVSNPAGACQSALPVYEDLIRKRPLATQNEGKRTAFVTCAMVSGGGVIEVLLYLAGTETTPRAVSCTAVAGYNTGPAQYLTKTAMVTGDAQTSLRWENSEFPEQDLGSRFAVSCALPPGTSVNDYTLSWVNY